MDSETYQPRDGWKPTERSTCSTLDIHRATRDTSTGQFHKHDGDSTGMQRITVLSSLYAVRNWEIDFIQQTHIRQARNWMAAIGHAIHEVVSLHRCRCGQSYEQWGNQPTPPCPTCEKIRLKNTGPGKGNRRTIREQTEHLRPTSSFPP